MSTATITDILIDTHKQQAQMTQAVKACDLIYDGQLIPKLTNAIEAGNQSEFALLLSMLSNDAIEFTPTADIPEIDRSEEALRQQLQMPSQQTLRSTENSYNKGANIAQAFATDGLAGATLQAGLCPDALCYKPEHTQKLPETLYHNLSQHEKRHLKENSVAVKNEKELQLYQNLNQQRLLAYA